MDDVLESRVVAARAVAKALAIRLNLCLVVAAEDGVETSLRFVALSVALNNSSNAPTTRQPAE